MVRTNNHSGRLVQAMPIGFAVLPAVFGYTNRTVSQKFQPRLEPGKSKPTRERVRLPCSFSAIL